MMSYVDDLPFRQSCRALLVDPDDRVLLAQHSISEGTVWVGPGGGVEEGESLVDAIGRELHEETGLVLSAVHDPRLAWVQSHPFPEMREHGFGGVDNHFFLVRTPWFEPATDLEPGQPGHPLTEGILAMRWWSLDELDAEHARGVLFSPRALPTLLRDLLERGAPAEPLRLGL